MATWLMKTDEDTTVLPTTNLDELLSALPVPESVTISSQACVALSTERSRTKAADTTTKLRSSTAAKQDVAPSA